MENENEDINTVLDNRIESFSKEVFEVGSLVYTPQMLSRFIEKWTEPTRGNNPKLKFEKEKTWNTSLRLKTWATNNFDKIVCYNSELNKSIDEKKKDFIDEMSKFKKYYTSDILNSFYAHWSQPENKENPTKIKWETEEFWNTSSRLSSWKSRSEPKKEEELRYKPA